MSQFNLSFLLSCRRPGLVGFQPPRGAQPWWPARTHTALSHLQPLVAQGAIVSLCPLPITEIPHWLLPPGWLWQILCKFGLWSGLEEHLLEPPCPLMPPLFRADVFPLIEAWPPKFSQLFSRYMTTSTEKPCLTLQKGQLHCLLSPVLSQCITLVRHNPPFINSCSILFHFLPCLWLLFPLRSILKPCTIGEQTSKPIIAQISFLYSFPNASFWNVSGFFYREKNPVQPLSVCLSLIVFNSNQFYPEFDRRAQLTEIIMSLKA